MATQTQTRPPARSAFSRALNNLLEHGEGKLLAAHLGTTEGQLVKYRRGTSGEIPPLLFREIVRFFSSPTKRDALIRARLQDELPADDLARVRIVQAQPPEGAAAEESIGGMMAAIAARAEKQEDLRLLLEVIARLLARPAS